MADEKHRETARSRPEYVMPAYEDPMHWRKRKQRSSSMCDPSDSKLADPEERARMAREFDRGLTTPRGFDVAGASVSTVVPRTG